MTDWNKIVPNDLHEDFLRQVDEAVSAELMQIFIDCEDNADVDDGETEELLRTRFIDHYIDQFKKSLWPPKASAQLGIKAGSMMESNFWFCSACREKNPNSFDTCRKCNDEKPKEMVSERPVARPTVRHVEPVTVPVVVADIPPTWTCKECSASNPTNIAVCEKCMQHQDAYKRSTWPPVTVVSDAIEAKNLRMQLFNRIRAEFDMDDPFASIEISHEEFFLIAEKLKQIILDEYVASR